MDFSVMTEQLQVNTFYHDHSVSILDFLFKSFWIVKISTIRIGISLIFLLNLS